MVFRRIGTYAIVAILVALVVAALLFAGSAWSQGNNGDSKKDRKETRQEKRTQNRETRTENNRATQDPAREQQVGAQQVSAQAEAEGRGITLTKTDDPDPVEVDGLLLYTIEVTNNLNDDRPVVVRDDLPNSVNLLAVDISGGTDDGECIESDDEDEVVCEVELDTQNDNDTAMIQILVEPQEVREIENFVEVFEAVDCPIDTSPDCTEDNLVSVTEPTEVVNDRNRDNRNNRRDRIRDLLRDNPFLNNPNDFVDEDNDGIPDVFDEDIEEDEDEIDEDGDDEDIDEEEDGNVDSSVNSTSADDDCIETETDTDTNTDNETNSDTLEDSSTLDEDLSDEDTLDTNDTETHNSETASLERIDFRTVAFQTDTETETDSETDTVTDTETETDTVTDTETDTLDECEDEGDDGVSATSDNGQAEASTPGATARSGGDPDELEPESDVPDDVVDEIPTTGELPNTGGIPLAAGTMVALILFGAGLLAVRLVMIWRARRA